MSYCINKFEILAPALPEQSGAEGIQIIFGTNTATNLYRYRSNTKQSSTRSSLVAFLVVFCLFLNSKYCNRSNLGIDKWSLGRFVGLPGL